MAQPHQCRWLRKTMQLKSSTKHHWISCLMSILSEPLKGIIYILLILFAFFHVYTFQLSETKTEIKCMEQWLWQPCSKLWQHRSRVTCLISFNSRFWKSFLTFWQSKTMKFHQHATFYAPNTLNSLWIQNSLPPFLLADKVFNLKSFY